MGPRACAVCLCVRQAARSVRWFRTLLTGPLGSLAAQVRSRHACLGFHGAARQRLVRVSEEPARSGKLAREFAAGAITECRFEDKLIADGPEILFCALESRQCRLPFRERPAGQPFFLAVIEELLRMACDPDFKAFFSSKFSFANGVRLGVGVKTPRVPAVFDKKTKWRTYAEEDSLEVCTEIDGDNYLSAKDHADVVQQQFEAEAELGAMQELPADVARARYGRNFAVASLGPIKEKDGSYRVIHDGTHGVAVNSAIKIRDQLRSPTAGDLKACMETLQQDWGLLACRTGARKEEFVWVNCVGTFGISSAAYHWSRLMAGLGRSSFYLIGRLALDQLIYSDDLFWLTCVAAGVPWILLIIFYYVLLGLLGLPFAWRKFSGGLKFGWVGFELILKENALGLSVARAQWMIRWLSATADKGVARVEDVRAVLGRLNFGFTALCHLRPFLGPVYAWVAVIHGQGQRRLPRALILIFRFLSRALEGDGRAAPVGQQRVHEKAEGNEVWVGGWAIDDPDPRQCRWFSVRLDHASAPWLFTAGESYRQIAALELLATLMAVILFGVPAGQKCAFGCSAGTENRGNTYVVSWLLTTKFPLCAFLMELAVRLQREAADLHLYWLPRLQNEESDQLTNCDYRFDPAKRLRLDWQQYKGFVLQDMLDAGLELYEEISQSC